MKINRRQFGLLAGGGVLTLAAPAIISSRVAAQDNVVVVQIGTGDWADSNIAAYAEPFEAETGIRVEKVYDWVTINRLKLWHDSGNVEWDVANLGGSTMMIAGQNGWLEPIDYSLYSDEQQNAITKEAKEEYGVGALYYSTVLTYWTDQYAQGKAPKSWADFWNVDAFPGKRTLPGGERGYGPFEMALLADGVPIEELYPLDIDRAFASLDKIKRDIVKWWLDGSDNQQLFADRFVDVGAAYNGRIGNLQKQGLDLTMDWNQGKLEMDYWGIPKGARHSENAQRFINFATRGAQQAIFAQNIPYGPTNLNAYDHIPDDVAKNLPSYPENLKLQFARDYRWETQINEDTGKTNLETLIDRWNRWIFS